MDINKEILEALRTKQKYYQDRISNYELPEKLESIYPKVQTADWQKRQIASETDFLTNSFDVWHRDYEHYLTVIRKYSERLPENLPESPCNFGDSGAWFERRRPNS